MNTGKKRGVTRRKRAPSALSETSRAAQRRLILDEAARLVAANPDGFNMRELAAAVGASTMVLYSLFGSRGAIMVALFEESIERLGDEFERVTAPDPFTRLVLLAYTYRRYALSAPHYLHAVTHVPRAMGPDGSRIRRSRTFSILQGTVEQAIAAGIFAPADPRLIADVLWAVVHGIVAFEAAGYFADPVEAEARFHATGQAVLRGFLAAPPSP